MSVLRWVIKDPFSSAKYTFPRNPVSMTSIYQDPAITSLPTMQGRPLFWQGTSPAKDWSFTGVLLDKQNLVDMHNWILNKQQRLIVVDHFGRQLSVVFTKFDVTPKRRTNVYWSHDYTASALLFHINSSAAVSNAGPA